MDKLAAGIVDKLSIVGFFNVIISGSVLLYGCTESPLSWTGTLPISSI